MENNQKIRTNRKVAAISFLLCFLIAVGLLCYGTGELVYRSFGRVSPSQMMFHLSLSVREWNASPFLFKFLKFVICLVCGSSVAGVLLFFLIRSLQQVKYSKYLISAFWVFSSLFCFAGVDSMLDRIPLGYLLFFRNAKSEFFDRNFSIIAPENVKFTAKRNVIVLIAESLEDSFADPVFGGFDMIPGLNKLKQENISFDRRIQVNGTGWTIAGLTGVFYGIPQLPLHDGGNLRSRRSYNHFSLFDYFLKADYNCLYMQGGHLDFSGKNFLFAGHPDVKVISYNELQHDQQFKQNPEPFSWGVDDEVMFRHLYAETRRLASLDKPFFISALTLDLHGQECYLPPGHGKRGREFYIEVLRRMDKRIADYVNWVRNSDFGRDTLIVVVGDHLAMWGTTLANFDAYNGPEQFEGRRKAYNCFINPAVKASHLERRYACFDLMPTILHAAGAQWGGDRINLGVSLFGQSPTLLERFGIEHYERESLKYSAVYINGMKLEK